MYFLIPLIAVIAASLVGIYTDPHLIDPILKKTWRRTIDLSKDYNKKPQPHHKRAWSYILAKSRTVKNVLTRAGLERALKEIKVWESIILKSKVWEHVGRLFSTLTSTLTRYHLIFLIAALGVGVLFIFMKRRKSGSAYTEEIYTEGTYYISEYKGKGYMSSADLEPQCNIEEADTYSYDVEREKKERIEVAVYATWQDEEDEGEEEIFSEPEEQGGPTSKPIMSAGELGAEESSEPPAWGASPEQEEHEEYTAESTTSESSENVYDVEYGEDPTDLGISHGDHGEQVGKFLLGYEEQEQVDEEILEEQLDNNPARYMAAESVIEFPEFTEEQQVLKELISLSPTNTTAPALTSAEFPGAYNPRPQWKARELYFGPYWDGLVCIWKGPWPTWRGPPFGYDDSSMYIRKSSSRKIRSAGDEDQSCEYRPEWEGPNFHFYKHFMYTMGESQTRDLRDKARGTE